MIWTTDVQCVTVIIQCRFSIYYYYILYIYIYLYLELKIMVLFISFNLFICFILFHFYLTGTDRVLKFSTPLTVRLCPKCHMSENWGVCVCVCVCVCVFIVIIVIVVRSQCDLLLFSLSRLEDPGDDCRHSVWKNTRYNRKSLFKSDSVWMMLLVLDSLWCWMLCFHSYQFGNAVQRRGGSAGHQSSQSGHLLPSQRRSDVLHSAGLCWLGGCC